MTFTRREFISTATFAVIGMTIKADRAIEGGFVNDSFPLGHRIRDRQTFPAATRVEKFPIVIVGGGIAGLSAAWRLRKRGFTDFVLLEMNPQAGGNSRWGENAITAYPWAAHYVPVPGPKATYVRELFEDLGILNNGVWNERYLCFAPQERLYLYGRWQDGIEPATALSPQERDDFRRLEDLFRNYRHAGEFTVPIEVGRTGRFADLDRISFADWLTSQKVTSKLVTWYMNYACRDDYGALCTDTSAWAGIHYFASREADEKGPLTWPEGNGWIVRRLLERYGSHVRTSAPVHRIAKRGRHYSVFAGDTEYSADAVIFAAPTFLAPYVIEGFPRVTDFEYSPWLTANLTLDRIPRSHDSELAWDNVAVDSPTLGYVDARHQNLNTFIDKTVWTFYWSLAEGTPAANRRLLLDKDWSYWRDAILHDLKRLHPDIRSCVARIDVMRHGHAMIRPTIGAIFSPERRKLATARDRLVFANSDLSGISIFEEAQYHGVRAADAALTIYKT